MPTTLPLRPGTEDLNVPVSVGEWTLLSRGDQNIELRSFTNLDNYPFIIGWSNSETEAPLGFGFVSYEGVFLASAQALFFIWGRAAPTSRLSSTDSDSFKIAVSESRVRTPQPLRKEGKPF